MSQLAQFYDVERDALPALVDAAQTKPKQGLFRRKSARPFSEVFGELTRPLDDDFGWSGYYFAVLLAYLDEKGVEVTDSALDRSAEALSNAQGATMLVFPPADGEQLARLEPEAHDEEELRRYFEEFNECEEPEAGRAMRAALGDLHRHISGLDDSSVLLLTIG